MPTGLENELLNDSTVGSPSAEEVSYSGDREYDAGPNTGQYGFVEVEVDGQILECTNAYMSNAYGGQYCVGDTYTDPNGGTQTIREITMTGLDLAPAQWDAEETYADVGEKLGMSMQEWTAFSTELQELNDTVDGLKGGVLGPTQMHVDRVTGRIQQANPDWTPEQVQAEVDRVLQTEFETSDAYKAAAQAETALFEKYGITKENPNIYGSGVWIDSDGKYHKFESSSGNLYQTSQDTSILDVAVPIGIALGAGIISGGAASAITSGLTAGLSSTAAGAINGVLGSAISQGITTGGIDPSSLLQAAILGGIGGLAEGMVNGDWAGTDLDEAIWDMSDMLDMDYDEVVDMLQGVATGAVNGGDLEDIALGVVGNLGQNEIMNWVEEAYGDTINVDDWFKDGESHIPTEALEPIIGGVINAAIEGGMSNEDALKMAWDYFQAGGDVDFMLPDEVEIAFGDWFDGLPGLDFEKSDEWDIIRDEDGNYTINWTLPDLGGELDIECPEGWVSENGHCIEINIPDIQCPEGWVSENGHCVEINIPEIECPEGWVSENGHCVEIQCPEGWVSENGHCVEINVPEIECPEGWVSENGHCVEVSVIECMEGWEWSDLYGKCVEKIEIPDVLECMEGFEWDGQQCVEIPDVIECIEGFEWSDVYGKCVEKIPDDITIDDEVDIFECMEGWEWSDLYGKCVEKIPDDITIDDDTQCPEGWVSEAGHCVEIKVPDIDVPDLPEPPPPPQAQQGDFTPSWTGLFQTGTVDVYKAPPLRSLFKDYL